MKLKLLSTAAIAFSLAAAPVAFAQSGTAGSSGSNNASGNSNQPIVETDQGKTSSTGTNEGMTDADKKFYTDNSKMFSGFFTDDTWATPKSNDEIAAAFQAMGAEDQAGAKAACEAVQNDRGSHGSVTVALCQQIGQL